MDRRSALLAALKDYRARDAAEIGFRRRMLELLAAAGDPFSRSRFQPGHFTASAFVLAPGGTELLLIHHRRLDRWLQPGGHVEPQDRDLEAAARREVHEETGIDSLEPALSHGGPFDLDIHPIPARADQPGHLHHDVRYLFEASRRELRPAAEVRGAAWVAPAEAARRNREPAMHRVLTKLQHRNPAFRGEP